MQRTFDDRGAQHFDPTLLQRGRRNVQRVEDPVIFTVHRHRYITAFAASTTSATEGSASFSRLAAYGIGTSLPETRITGASRKSNALSMMRAAISAPTPDCCQPSSTTTQRLVFFTELSTVSVSIGRSVRRSITSAWMCFLANSSAAFSA